MIGISPIGIGINRNRGGKTAITSPVITTTTITAITMTTATGGGNVTSDGGASVTAKGICWDTSANPTTANSHTSDGTGTGSFASSLVGLVIGTLYHVRAYATNSAGTSYGDDVQFTSVNYDADALALFARMTALSETPDAARKTILNDAFILGKTKAFWPKMNGIWLLAAHGTLSSRLNILADAFNVTLSGTPAFETDRGWTAALATNLGFNFNFSTNGGTKYTKDSACDGFYSRTNSQSIYPVVGTATTTSNTHVIYTGNHLYWRINSTAYTDDATPGSIANLVTCVRTSATNINVYIGTSKKSTTANSTAIPNVSAITGNSNPNQLALRFIGAALDDQDIADIIAVFVTGYLTSIGAKV